MCENDGKVGRSRGIRGEKSLFDQKNWYLGRWIVFQFYALLSEGDGLCKSMCLLV